MSIYIHTYKALFMTNDAFRWRSGRVPRCSLAPQDFTLSGSSLPVACFARLGPSPLLFEQARGSLFGGVGDGFRCCFRAVSRCFEVFSKCFEGVEGQNMKWLSLRFGLHALSPGFQPLRTSFVCT